MKKNIMFILSFLIIFLSCFSINARCYDPDYKTKSQSVYLINLDTGAELYEKDADVLRFPASTTKIMTYIIVAENVDDLKNTMVKITYEDIHSLDGTGSSMSGLENYIDKSLSVFDLLNCLMVKSGNDAAVVLANYVGGSIEKFAELMNNKATELGCKNTHFVNPHGLHDQEHYTTAKDLALITQYAQSLPYFMEICGTATYYLPDADYPLVATNSLIDPGRGGEYYYDYATGVKTGTTDEAGFCLVATATKGGYSYMCIALNAACYDDQGEWASENGAMMDCKKLFEWAFDNFSLRAIVNENTPICNIDVKHSWDYDSILLTPEKSFNIILPDSVDVSSVDIIEDVPEYIEAPITKGQIVGKAQIKYADKVLGTINLVASESLEASEVLQVSSTVKDYVESPNFYMPIICILFLFIVLTIIISYYSSKRKKKK